MEFFIILLKSLFLTVGIVYTFSNIIKAFYKQTIGEFQIWAMGIGIVGFIYFQFWYMF